jgi:hypothetical protein
MASVSETRGVPLGVSEHQLQAVVRHAQRQADLAADVLTGMGLAGPRGLPPAYLLELAAVLEIGLWERLGLRDHLNASLPAFGQAAAQLAARAALGPTEFDVPDATPLSDTVLTAWMNAMAWDGREFFGAEIVLGDVDEEEFVSLLAEFLWTHRHEHSELISRQEHPV